MKHIELGLIGLSKVYNSPLDNDLIDIWIAILKDLSEAEFNHALSTYVKSGTPFFPKPGQIYSIARPEINPEGEAQEIAEAVWKCACSYGTDRAGAARAREKIGEVGWAMIENHGGWSFFLQGITDVDQAAIYKSQWRKVILGLLQRKKAGQPLLRSERSETPLVKLSDLTGRLLELE